MPSQFVKNPSHARIQACRIGGHAFGARYTACSMISGNGLNRVRRRRFAVVRSGLHQGRLRQKRLQQCSFHHPLSEHRSPLNLLLHVMEAVQHDRNIITNGRRGARADRRGAWFLIDGLHNLFLYLLNIRRTFLNDRLFLHSGISNYVLRHLSCNDLFMMDLMAHGLSKLFNKEVNQRPVKPQEKW